jgi:hypothetical protein
MYVGLVAVCALSPWAGAAQPIDAATLGNIDAAIGFCRQLNPANEATYAAFRVSVIGSLQGAALTALTETPEYRAALEAGTKELADKPHDIAAKECAALKPARAVGTAKGPKHH